MTAIALPARQVSLAAWQEVGIQLCLHSIFFRSELPQDCYPCMKCGCGTGVEEGNPTWA